MSSMEIAALAVLAALAVAGFYLDARYRLLPNWLCAAGLLAGIGFGAALHGWAWAGSALLHSLLALVAGMGLFSARIIGGGDAKFYAALAAWFPIAKALLLLLVVSLAGLVLVILVWFPLRRYLTRPQDGTAAAAFAKVPYGVAIATGALATYSLL